jgi:lipopolysaccharide export system ATP-binding protein
MTDRPTPVHGVILPGDAEAFSIPPRVLEAVAKLTHGDRSVTLVLTALLASADESGAATLNDIAIALRDAYLSWLRAEGRDADREAERLSLDEVRRYLAASLLPRLGRDGVIVLPSGDLDQADARVAFAPVAWAQFGPFHTALSQALRASEERTARLVASPVEPEASDGAARSVLEATGLLKVYRNRKVVNDVAVRLQQGEIVGMLGPNGAGKTTTFYMIVGLIPPAAGRIVLDGEDITDMPMYRRARRGIGYLSQEPSVFRKLTVEDNILAILETLPMSAAARRERLEVLLDELSIKHLRKNKAYSLSGGERRRLEITRALVTQPKFMMLDEPFAGVDPIAVHDIQSIVAGLRHRGIGVLISDHNVEQTLDIVDRAYIMFDGEVKVSGTVRELVFDDTVAEIYLGPTLTARLRARFAGGRLAA